MKEKIYETLRKKHLENDLWSFDAIYEIVINSLSEPEKINGKVKSWADENAPSVKFGSFFYLQYYGFAEEILKNIKEQQEKQ